MHAIRPKVSGKWSALLIGVCFLVSAVLLPTAAHLPHWVELELALGIWWIVWFVLLSWMLFQGHEVEDDADRIDFHNPKLPWLATALEWAVQGFGCGAAAGCEAAIVLGLAVLVFFGSLYLALELLIPFVAFIIYLAIREMAARVINDKHHCGAARSRARP